jgi:hypothetical protein
MVGAPKAVVVSVRARRSIASRVRQQLGVPVRRRLAAIAALDTGARAHNRFLLAFTGQDHDNLSLSFARSTSHVSTSDRRQRRALVGPPNLVGAGNGRVSSASLRVTHMREHLKCSITSPISMKLSSSLTLIRCGIVEKAVVTNEPRKPTPAPSACVIRIKFSGFARISDRTT